MTLMQQASADQYRDDVGLFREVRNTTGRASRTHTDTLQALDATPLLMHDQGAGKACADCWYTPIHQSLLHCTSASPRTHMLSSAPLSLRRAGLCAAVALLISISTGRLKCPLPYPAAGSYVHPVSPDVLPWRPQPLQGPYQPNNRLLAATRLFDGRIHGSESVTVAPDGRLVMVDKYTQVWQAHPQRHSGDTSDTQQDQYQLEEAPLAQLGPGRPLGFHFDNEGNLIVADSLKGLLKLHSGSGMLEVLATHVSPDSPLHPGTPITYANDLAVAPDGAIYFTSCSNVVPARNAKGFWDTFRAWQLDLAQGSPQGKVMVYYPHNRTTHVLADGFYYANGVALSADGSYLVLAETNRLRLHKLWLTGAQRGRHQVLIENLPAVPDGVDPASDGGFWVSLVAPVPPIAKFLREPAVRAVYAWLPSWARPRAKPFGGVLKVYADGRTGDMFTDTTGRHVSFVSAVSEHDGKLFLGNLVGSYVSVLDLHQPHTTGNSSQQ